MTDRKAQLSQNPNLTPKTVEVVERILSKNDREANLLRTRWQEYPGLYVVNLMSSPGSGKTTLLEQMARHGGVRFGVIEGDLETNRDAERLQKLGVHARQITTGTACHLEALMVRNALEGFALEGLEYLFIENVGNLVCPASYDLGAHLNIALLSVPEGDDKVLKYPSMFRCADAVLITKYDLLPHFDYALERVREDMLQLNPKAEILTLCAKEEGSLRGWLAFLESKKQSGYTSTYTFP